MAKIAETSTPQTFTLTVTKDGTGTGTVTSSPAGIDCGTDCTESYTSGTVVTLTATPDSGSTFAGWSGDPDCTDGQVAMTADKTCTATFNTQTSQTFTLTVFKTGTGSGTVTSNLAGINCGTDCTESYSSGTVVTLTATADSGSTFEGWSCSETESCVLSMTADRNVTASFSTTTPDYTAYQTRPIPLGVSGGNINDISQGFCCGGTLGGLVTDGNSFFILSNNHVLAKSNNATIGDDIVQPGLNDTYTGEFNYCKAVPENIVADLTKFQKIGWFAYNKIDAAIAEVNFVDGKEQVDLSGTILGIGTPGSTPVAPYPHMKVKKSGRTTGLTHGTIEAIDVTIMSLYPWKGQCRSEIEVPAIFFRNQIRIVGTGGSSFSAEGDSGSLVVENEDEDDCPHPVGLIFAQNDDETESFANPIEEVLNTFGVTVVGCQIATSTSAEEPGEEKNIPIVEELRPGKEAVAEAIGVKRRYEHNLMGIAGVIGAGVGFSQESGQVVIEVYVEEQTPDLEQLLPRALEGIPVEIVVTGKVYAR